MSGHVCDQCGIDTRKYPDLYHTGNPRGGCEVALYRDNADLRLQLDASGIEDMRNEIAFLRAALDQMTVERRVGDLLHAKTVAALEREREKVERLQRAAGDAIHHLEKARIWGGMGWHWNHLRKELAEKAHALLSGRGEGEGNG